MVSEWAVWAPALSLSLSTHTHTHTHTHTAAMPAAPSLLVSRHLVGSGHDWGGLATHITNSAPHTIEVLYLEMVPWFFRVYLHTLAVSQGESGKV